jgi:hypothetical protein
MRFGDKADDALSEAILRRIKATMEELDYWVQVYNQINPEAPLGEPLPASRPEEERSVLSLLTPKGKGPSDS